jgi:hypothetical protein
MPPSAGLVHSTGHQFCRKNRAEPRCLQTDVLFQGYNYLNAARTNLVFALGIG